MNDTIILLNLPLVPGLKAVQDITDAGWKNQSGAIYFLRSNEARVTASIRMFSDKFPNLAQKKAARMAN